MGDGQPAGQNRSTGKSGVAVRGLLATQVFLLGERATTRQSVPAGWPVPW